MTGRARETLGLVAPFLLWALGFVLLYAAHGFACGVGVRPGHYDGLTRLLLAAVLVATVLAHLWMTWRYWQRLRTGAGGGAPFLRRCALALSIAALGTTLWTGTPVLFLRICA